MIFSLSSHSHIRESCNLHYVIENATYALNSILLTVSSIVLHMFSKEIIKHQKVTILWPVFFLFEVNRQVPLKDMQCLTNWSLIHHTAGEKILRDGFTLKRRVHQYVNFTRGSNPASKIPSNINTRGIKKINWLVLVMHIPDNSRIWQE